MIRSTPYIIMFYSFMAGGHIAFGIADDSTFGLVIGVLCLLFACVYLFDAQYQITVSERKK